jgi:hypothetical protein
VLVVIVLLRERLIWLHVRECQQAGLLVIVL